MPAPRLLPLASRTGTPMRAIRYQSLPRVKGCCRLCGATIAEKGRTSTCSPECAERIEILCFPSQQRHAVWTELLWVKDNLYNREEVHPMRMLQRITAALVPQPVPEAKPSGFTPRDGDSNHDMPVGPCSCGATHKEGDLP